MESQFCKPAVLNPFNMLAEGARKDLLKPSTFHTAKYVSGSYQEVKG